MIFASILSLKYTPIFQKSVSSAEKKNVISTDRVRMLKFVCRISPRNKRHCKARRKQNTLQLGEKRIVRLARITNCRCPLDGLKPVDSNYEIVHRGDCDCDFKPNATRHPTRHSRVDIVSLVESRFRTMHYAGFVKQRAIRTRYFVALSANANLLLHRRIYYFVYATWHFYTTHGQSKKYRLFFLMKIRAKWNFHLSYTKTVL